MQKNKLYCIKNVDKKLHQAWGDKEHSRTNLLNFPRPYRMLLTAMPNCGKSMLIKNLLLQMDPIPKRIWIAHAETWTGDYTENNMVTQGVKSRRKPVHDPVPDSKKLPFLNYDIEEIPEYAGVKAIYLRTLPPISYWDEFKDGHNLLIIDDVNLKEFANKSRVRMNCIDKTWSWASTHRNLTIICSAQSIYQQLVPSIYRFSNVFVIWRMTDKYMQSQLARNCGVETDVWKSIFNLCESPYDSITVDNTLNTPARLRYNLVEPILCGDDAELASDEDSDQSDSDDDSDS